MGMAFDKEFLRAYFISGTQDIKDPTLKLSDVLEQALSAGVTAFQYREKGPGSLDGADKLALAKQLKQICQRHHVPFIIDDDVELATETQADGIHVGQKDERVTKVIEQVGDKMFVGLSCDTPEQVELANATPGISYIGSGPVYPTGSKADADPVIGVDGVAKLVKISHLPVVAIGGITIDNISELPATGVAGASVISMIAQSKNIRQTVEKITATFPN